MAVERLGEGMTAFEATFDADTRDRLVGALVVMCGDRSIAEEIAQDALAKGWAHWPRIQHFRSPRAWVWRCAMNAAASAGRRSAAEKRALVRGFERESDELDHASRLALRECVDQLTERQRAAIVCRYYGELSVKETAKVLGCREGTVKALTSQAIASLREMDLVERARPEVIDVSDRSTAADRSGSCEPGSIVPTDEVRQDA